METNDGAYFERRMREELAKAAAATSLEAQHVHETLARLYRIRLGASGSEKLAA